MCCINFPYRLILSADGVHGALPKTERTQHEVETSRKDGSGPSIEGLCEKDTKFLPNSKQKLLDQVHEI
jgi:hypothetical protein